MPEAPRLSVLLLCDDGRGHATTLLEHVDAFRRYSRHDVRAFNPRGLARTRSLSLDEFDAVVVHYSLMVSNDHYVSPDFRSKLRAFDGLKVQYIQDDYRQVDRMAAAIRDLGIDVLYTLYPEREAPRVWTARLPGVLVRTTLAGYVSQAALRYASPPLAERPLDVGYRGRAVPMWLGRLGQEKAWIAQAFAERAAGTGLRVDLGWREGDRIYGRSWFEFISSCRATLGTESGASITDFDGTLQQRTEMYLAHHPDATFDEVWRELLAPFEGNVPINVVSPRIFEAAALRTAMVLFPGEYSGVVEPDRHYIPLEKDFSNFDEVVARLRDVRGLERLVATAHREIAQADRYSYRAMVRDLDAVLDERGRPRTRAGRKLRYRVSRIERPARAFVTGADTGRTVLRAAGDGLTARVARAAMATHLLLMDRDAARLALRRGGGAPLADVVRLAALRSAHRGRRSAGDVFAVDLDAAPEQLVLRSVARGRWRPPDPAATAPAGRRLVWDHSELGRWYHHRLTRQLWVALPVAPDAQEPAYAFQPPAELDAEVDALLAAFAVRPNAEPLSGVALLLHFVRHAGFYAPRALATAELLRGSGNLRRLLLAGVRDAAVRQEAPARLLVSELVRLRLLAAARAGALPLPSEARIAARMPDPRTLRFETTRAAALPDEVALDESVPPALERIVWDHSGEGASVVYVHDGREVPFALGTAGELEFETIGVLLRRHPELTWEAVLRP